MTRSDRIIVAAAGGAVVLAIAAAVVLLLPTTAPRDDAPAAFLTGPSAPAVPVASGSPAGGSTGGPLVVDVAGAVARPGLVELPAGSRVGDAIAAAGGYAGDADLDAASGLNLARPLEDGEQVRVPRIGEVTASSGAPPTAVDPAAGGAGTGTPGTAGGLVNLNTATPEELEALPGIGAVTVQKIVAARQEQPFASLEDALQRGVIHRGQLEDIRELATAG